MPDLTRRDVAKAGAALAFAGIAGPSVFAQRLGPGLGGLDFVNPELRAAARQILTQTASFPPISAGTLPQLRKGIAGYGGPPALTPAWTKRVIPGPAGAAELTVYVINSRGGSSRPAILHTHGGGYVMGSALSQILDLQKVAAMLDCVIVTVEYRLAPEVTYRGSIEDNYAGLRWLHDNAGALGVDRQRIAVMGESAGGGHAALLAIAARDRGEVPLVLQVLTYPMLDDRTGTTRHPPFPIGAILWREPENRFGWSAFLGQDPGTADVPPIAVPARQVTLHGLAPAWIGVGSIDLFVDEDIDYGHRLVDAGVPTELLVVPGAFHGFDGIAPQASVSKAFARARLDALARAFGNPLR